MAEGLCFLPPQCLFCKHAEFEDGNMEGADCAAFDEIPEAIFSGEFDHAESYPGDKGVQFELVEQMREEFLEINELRVQMGMEPYRLE